MTTSGDRGGPACLGRKALPRCEAGHRSEEIWDVFFIGCTMFPYMEMRIREEAHDFLRNVQAQLDEDGEFDTKLTLEEPSDLHCSCVGFAPKAPQVHEGLVGLFVNWAHEYPVIRLQVVASRWQPEWPTYAVIRQAAEGLFLPVIRNYNRRHRTRYRMKIESLEETLPKLSPAAQAAFDQFAQGANVRALHPFDWQRFYRFVQVCYATQNNPYEADVSFLLRKAGFAADYANFIAQVYTHCREFYIQSDWRRALGDRRRNRPRGIHDDRRE